jgi:hypothetical protein
MRGRGLYALDAARYAGAIPRGERMRATRRFVNGALLALCALALLACTPKVQVEAPKEPITINMNIKIEHEIRVKVDKDLDQLFDKNDEIF